MEYKDLQLLPAYNMGYQSGLGNHFYLVDAGSSIHKIARTVGYIHGERKLNYTTEEIINQINRAITLLKYFGKGFHDGLYGTLNSEGYTGEILSAYNHGGFNAIAGDTNPNVDYEWTDKKIIEHYFYEKESL